MGRPEDSRVKIPALVHFTRLGYTYMSIKDKERNVDYDGDTNIFYSQFLSAVNRINQTELTLEDAKKIIGELKIKLDNDDLGKSFFKILQSGIDGIKLIDFSDITGTKNDYTVVTELPYENGDDNFRPDIVVLINGIPLSFIEVKRQNNREGILTERSRMERRFSNKIYRRFVGITQFTVFSNNNEYDDSDIEPIQGAFYASSSYKRMFFSKFREQREDELKADMKPIVTETEEFVLSDNNLIAIKGTPEYVSSLSEKSPTNRIITSLYTKERLLFLLKYGICYKTTTNKDGITEIEKHIMRYPQLFATLAIRDKLREGVRKGVIWHTQGSGKTALAYSNVHFLSDYFSKEEGKIAKFYFIVDRLDLAEQAKNEFEARGLKVKLIKDKEEFIADITNPGESNTSGKVTMTVINIQKFSKESVTKPSDYNVDVQRVYFLDEAHRSYNPTGSFLANLMASDRDAVQIALTGTPLIGDGYNTKDVFGNYIHKYYYNQSIADGYTLKLIREEIETTYKNQLNATLDQIVRQGSIAKKNLYAHPKFVEKMVDYIIQDFEEGRTALDSSIGAMIVCDSSEQAREVDRQLKRFSAYTHALVLHDEGTKQDRKNDQEEFKKGNIDILVVYNMLLTGFDAPRLKKQYLARMIKAHNLLQTLTRVNRPYKGYHYGYVVDFANIKDEFDKTNKAYFDELQSELGDEVQNYSNIFKSKEDIEKDLNDVKNQLFLYDTSNVVSFINQISEIDDKKQLLNLRQALENYKAMYNLIRLYGYEDLYTHFNVENAIKCLNEVNNRISIINLKNSIDSSEDMSQILNMALDQIDFQFRKIKEEELIIADAFRDTLEKTRREIVDRCLDPKDPEYISLLDELKRVFKKKNIEELTADEMKQMMGDLNALKKKAEKRNLADRMLAVKYSGDVKYMRTHKRIMNSPPPITDAVTIHRILMTVKSKADDQIAHNENILDNEEYFIKSLQPIILRACMGEKVKLDKPQLMFIDNCLSKEYILERDWVS
ncbi:MULTISPECIES: type I restriction endonuclease subunit R [Bacillota]|jgi:type I restriction enzyme R subunit|uniref:type I site-specific deoxyribonuclease n=1 Tax=Coprococcus comes TaxID=410072 RepID=A0A3R5XDU4_9FIRM|nr:DEAD/DEAH box helicase family protein [Coprococcus comes]MDU3305740.1 DEAD/DEAH box helicase family protein [Lachnospiraceae bacterium]RGU44693.1 type I restriction endonuclease subunit R [Coprococcus comes]RHQ89636.1 type I restriction endonuclease subunit R [Ruminococcus sp. AF21-42]